MSAVPTHEFPPGTHLLEDSSNDTKELILNPTPSDDPEDPLNWSTLRKTINFGLTCTYVMFTFVLLDIGSVINRQEVFILHLTQANINQASGAAYAGLAGGALLLIPCVHKFGRRPIYLISAALQFAGAIWWAKFTTAGEMIAINLLTGIAGSVSEAIVMITVADLFFVHQHARMNGIFIFMQSVGTLGGPIAAGYIVVNMGWRWIWWFTAIFTGVNFLLVLFFFEESKYVPSARKNTTPSPLMTQEGEKNGASEELAPASSLESQSKIYPRKTYRQRLAFYTKTDEPMLPNFYRPLIVLGLFPAVLFAALQYGIILSWFSATVSAGSYYLVFPPYNFQANAIGLFNIGGFIGTLLSTATMPFLNDRLIVWQSRRNGGIFEPEMRLWMLFPAILMNSVGSWVFGIGLSRGWHWVILAVGNGIFGFGFMITADVSLTYLTDCYPQILGDALIFVVFIRNGFAMIIRFAYTDWLHSMGLQNTFVLIGVISFATMIMPAIYLVYGKRFRERSTAKYREYSAYRPSRRAQS